MDEGFKGYRHWTSPISSLDLTFPGQTIVTGLHPLSSLDFTLNWRFRATGLHLLPFGNKRFKYIETFQLIHPSGERNALLKILLLDPKPSSILECKIWELNRPRS